MNIPSPDKVYENEIIGKHMELSHCLFVFESQEQLQNVWNKIVGNTTGSVISHNTFVVMKHKWLIKLIKFLLKVK